ncbi:MAG: phosphate/phosphite/phosphonate ABC transporter substrate-binding protein [Chloroflexota bacterium]|nr:PhnD/SsuA/transferrin family substrate-binding protein [Chloroflexota bacterium]MBI5703043.1 PhnD/SsuA/transferrin family substrate-binding protein [Chloroflexota bacterium]
MKRPFLVPTLFVLTAFVLGNCTLPPLAEPTPTVLPIPVTAPAVEETPLLPAAELGLAENPIILALPPSAESQPEQVNAAREIAAQFTERTGYFVVVVAPDSYAALMDALEKGNAHIALLDPLSYALAYQKDLVRAQYAVVRDEKIAYGTQFLAPRRDGFTSYFNAEIGDNTADASVALAQFAGKKPCWSEETSLSGYIVPLGMLNQAQVQTRSAAFAGDHAAVVRSLYVGGICDFGATYIDARKFPSLEDAMPDLVEQVLVIWRSEDIIPYDVLVFSTRMPPPMRTLFRDLIPAIRQTETGYTAFQTAYGFDEIQAVNDGDFGDFHAFMREAGLDLAAILRRR